MGKRVFLALLLGALWFFNGNVLFGQSDSAGVNADSLNTSLLVDYKTRLAEIEQQRINDSLRKAELEEQINALKSTENLQKEELLRQLKAIEEEDSRRLKAKKSRIDSLRSSASGYPVLGVFKDTLFVVYSKFGASRPQDRASNISNRIKRLFDDDFLKIDSLICLESEDAVDIVYGETIIMSVSESDALWQDTSKLVLAQSYVGLIKADLLNAKEATKLSKVLIRIGLLLGVLLVTVLIFWLIGRGVNQLLLFFEYKKDKWLRNLAYKDYTFLTAEQEYKVILFLLKPLRWLTYALVLWIALPVVFSIFPFTRSWANYLFTLVWTPFRGIFVAVWEYLPNLFTILVIYFVMKNVIRFVKYVFGEIESEKLRISGFHADWAMPTFSIVRFLLYAFTLVLIFPNLPGSDSEIFKGVSVFVGILFSLGSSTAIANMVAGLVITYMRPFKIGDRIRIGEVFGDVEEKTLLVTRIKTPKNEVITIPNSAVLSGNTINYSSEIVNHGLILHTTVTIGYDVPWHKMHSVLIEAALRTEHILPEPKPFVLQTSLEDFYVAYQINAYTKEVKRQAVIQSNLHQNIQDVCNENGIEIMSPHYRAQRDGNASTIPSNPKHASLG
jgi:small-conductance mechanosensitive channel